MRQRTDSRSGKAPTTPLEKNFREIVVGSGRSQEPYVIAFHYASDNVSGSPLGTLFGFFEVEIHDQDAAYIVNFLASVAKKEYFANPRRSPIESFEAALHKINVALAEIVKHGNISWLGHLHGAIGAVSENYLSFSVTGEGELYLAREESLQSISAGLAETGSEPHPLKTFTEVSSGDLHDGDLVFALSPSIWSLFSPEDLRRSLNRLGPAGFEQFLRTALVNELPIAAVTLLTCSAPVELKKEVKSKESKKPAISLGNVWSDTPFVEAQQTKGTTTPPPSETPLVEPRIDEYTDKKTGHIYVQASSDETFEGEGGPWKERWEIYSHALGNRLRSWNVSTRKTSRRIGKESTLALDAFGSQLAAVKRSFARKARSTKRATEGRWQKFREQQRERQASQVPIALPIHEEPASEQRAQAEQDFITAVPSPSTPVTPDTATLVTSMVVTQPRPGFRDHAKRLLVSCHSFKAHIQTTFNETLRFLRVQSTTLFSWMNGLWQTLAPKEKWSLLAILLGLCIIGSIALIRTDTSTSSDTVEEALPQAESPAVLLFPPADEPLATLLAESQSSLPSTDSSKSIALVNVNQEGFLVTEKSIVNLKTEEPTPTPEPIRLATAMDDLDALFVLGDSGTLYLYSVTNKKFEKNSLPVSGNIDAIGSYLTYLYVFDRDTKTISRFPRAEGGFGAPVTWSKESVSTGTHTAFSVYENILLADGSGRPALFSRGRNTGVGFSGTTSPVSADAAAFDTKTGDILALDREHKRIVRWSATGALVAQYFHESFAQAEMIAVSPTGELLVSSQTSVTTWEIQ